MAKTTGKGTGDDATTKVTKKKVAKKKVAKKKVAKKTAAAKSPAKKAPAKKAATKKTTATKKTVAKKPAAKRAPARQVTLEERHRLIAEAAFLRSEAQGFRGDPCQDWLSAEADVDARLAREGITVIR